MSNNLKTYIISAKVICTDKTVTVKKATIKNCYTDLHAKMKFEGACRDKYDGFIRCEVLSCRMDWTDSKLGDILDGIFKMQ